MFAIFTEDRDIVMLGPDTLVYLDHEQESNCVNIFAGRWMIGGFSIKDDEGERPEAWDLALELLDSLFQAMVEGKRGFDVVAFLNTPPGG